MEIKRVALVLVDISGYTRFMKLHTMSLLHAESIITEPLEAVIDQATKPFSHRPNPRLTRLHLWSYFVMGIGGNVVATLRHRLTRMS